MSKTDYKKLEKSPIWQKLMDDFNKPKVGRIKYKELVENIYRAFKLQGLGLIDNHETLNQIYELMGEYNKGDYPLRRYSAGKKK